MQYLTTKIHEGGQLPYCRRMDAATLNVSRSFPADISPSEEGNEQTFQLALKLPVDISDR